MQNEEDRKPEPETWNYPAYGHVPVGQEPVEQLPPAQGRSGRDPLADALNAENFFSSFFDPQFGQAGWREPVTSCSEISPQARQMYSKSGMGSGAISRR